MMPVGRVRIRRCILRSRSRDWHTTGGGRRARASPEGCPEKCKQADSLEQAELRRATEELEASREVVVELCSGCRISLVEVSDRVDHVGDRLFGIGDLQRPRAASMISRARLSVDDAALAVRFQRGFDAGFFFWG